MTSLLPPELIDNLQASDVGNDSGVGGANVDNALDTLDTAQALRVVGPGTATDNAIVRFDLTTGKLVQDSGVIIDDSDNITGILALTATGLGTVEELLILAGTGTAGDFTINSDLAAGTIGQMTFLGHDDGAVDTNYARILSNVVSNASPNEDGELVIQTIQSGSLLEVGTFELGYTAIGATGGDQGVGSGNFASLFIDGAAVVAGTGDMVLADVQTVTGAKSFDSGTLKLNGATSGTITLNATAVAGTGTITFPVATDTLAVLALAQSLTNKSMDNTNTVDIDALADIANLRVVGNTSGGAAAPAEVTIFDEDNMASDSATALVTQQSVKAFVESQSHQAGAWSLTLYTDPADFTAGSTTALTLPIASAGDAEANVWVFFNGLAQHSGQWTISGTTITFSSAIPVGVTDIEIRVFTVS